MARGIVAMDALIVVTLFWPVILTFVGGCIMRNANNRIFGAVSLVGLSILATWAMGCGDLSRTAVWVSLVCGGALGLAADLDPILRDLQDLFGCGDQLDQPPP